MLKVVGILLIILASTLIGTYFVKRHLYYLEDLQALLKGLTMLESEIHYAKSPLPIALEQIGIRLETNVRLFFIETAQELQKKSGKSIFIIWKETIEKNMPYTYLTKEEQKLLDSFGKTLGYLDREMQIKNIALIKSSLNEQIQQAFSYKNQQATLYQRLGILGGLLLIIILL
ncbi:MAG: hypothetical protein GX238_03260 [Epulopiscium sp.]|nr:hypothetical protein [Candidatus Epulonipiscium sp.]